MRQNIQRLNLECLCKAVAETKLAQCLDRQSGQEGFGRQVQDSRPHLFSHTPLFIHQADAKTMADMVLAIERVAAGEAWVRQALVGAPETAWPDFGLKSAFMGYDFHIGDEGPRLIEINTNAGGAFLNQALLEVVEECCADSVPAMIRLPDPKRLESSFIDMFQAELEAQKPGAKLQSVAIVDDGPQSQYLMPEFELCKAAFERAGIMAAIVDPVDLDWRDGKLWHGQTPVDLVYNRLVDFGLDEERHAHLRAACLAGAVVMTPSPRAHALLANKRHLALLSDAKALVALGADKADADLIAAHVPPTVLVSPENADALWSGRKRWFFKPASGHAGKAAYRGDKITKRAWEDVLSGGPYVAQEVAPPSERGVMVDGVGVRLKADIRLYTYDGQMLLMAARLYQGQTTNFRTQGGGFAPVLAV